MSYKNMGAGADKLENNDNNPESNLSQHNNKEKNNISENQNNKNNEQKEKENNISYEDNIKNNDLNGTNTEKKSENNNINEISKIEINNNEKNNISKTKLKRSSFVNGNIYKKLRQNEKHNSKISKLSKKGNKLYSFYSKDVLEQKIKDKNKLKNLIMLNKTTPIYDKEELLNELYNIKKEIEIMNIELFQLRKLEKKFQNRFISNKVIIEKILNIKEEENEKECQKIENKNEDNKKSNEKINNNTNMKSKKENDKKDNEEKSNLNNKDNNMCSLYLTEVSSPRNEKYDSKVENENGNELDVKEFEDIDNIKSNRNDNERNKEDNMIKNYTETNIKYNTTRANSTSKKKKYKIDRCSKLILSLKRDSNIFDKSLEKTTKILESKKNDSIVNTFLRLNSSIEEKKNNIRKLSSKKKALSKDILTNERKFGIILMKSKKILDEQKKLNKFIDYNNLTLTRREKQIESLYLEKENITKLINNLEEKKTIYRK